MISAFKLNRMKRKDLLQYAEKIGCEIEAGMQRPAIIAAIKARQGSSNETAAALPAPREPGNKQLFDDLTLQPGTTDAGTDDPLDTSGDPSPGPGRKPGKTNEQCKLDKLPTEANRSVKYALKYIFKIWSKAVDCPAIELDEDELQEYAVDTTQFLEYHGIMIPQGLHVDGKFVLGGIELIGSRVVMVKAHKERMKRLKEKEQQKEQAGDVQG